VLEVSILSLYKLYILNFDMDKINKCMYILYGVILINVGAILQWGDLTCICKT